MKVLLTGADGQLGRALRKSSPDGATLIAAGRASLDIGDAAAVAACVEREAPEFIVNAAAFTAVDTAERQPDAARRANAEGPGHLARAAGAVGARLVHVSTDFVFDGARGRPYRPEDPAAPLGVYGETKKQGEDIVLAAAPRHLIVRSAWVYAASGRNFVTTMLGLMKSQVEVRVVADQIGTPTHAASLARAIWALIRAEASGIHHFTDAGAASWYDFAVAIAEEGEGLEMIGPARIVPIASADYPAPARRPPYSVLDNSATWPLTGIPRHWRAELRLMLGELKALEGKV